MALKLTLDDLRVESFETTEAPHAVRALCDDSTYPNCTGCTNCSNCSECSDCSGCTGCSNCTDCTECSNCTASTDWSPCWFTKY